MFHLFLLSLFPEYNAILESYLKNNNKKNVLFAHLSQSNKNYVATVSGNEHGVRHNWDKLFIITTSAVTRLYTQSGTSTTHPIICNSRFGSKVGQIGPKWDKSGTFSDQISVHFGAI